MNRRAGTRRKVISASSFFATFVALTIIAIFSLTCVVVVVPIGSEARETGERGNFFRREERGAAREDEKASSSSTGAASASSQRERTVLPEGAKTTQDLSKPRNFKPVSRRMFKEYKLNLEPLVLRFEKAQLGWPTTKNLTISNLNEEEPLKVYMITSDTVQVYTEGVSYGRTKYEEKVMQRNLLMAREMLENRRDEVEKHEEKIRYVRRRIDELSEKLRAANEELDKKASEDALDANKKEHESLKLTVLRMQKMIEDTEEDVQRSSNQMEEIMKVGGEALEESRLPFGGKEPVFVIPPLGSIDVVIRHAPLQTGRGRGTLSVQTDRGDILMPFTFLTKPNEFRVQSLSTKQVYGVPHDYDLGLFNPLLKVLNVTDVWTRSDFIKIDVPWANNEGGDKKDSSSTKSPSPSPSSISPSSSSQSSQSSSFDGNNEGGSPAPFGWSIQPGTFSRLVRVTLTAPLNRHGEENAPSSGSVHSVHGAKVHQGIVFVKTATHSQPFEFPVSVEGVDNTVFTHPTEIDFGTIIVSEENRKQGSKKPKERRSIYVTNGDLWPIRITSVSSPTSDIRPQLVSGRGVTVKPGAKAEAARVWYDVKSRRTTPETFVAERVTFTVENSIGTKFNLDVLVRALVYTSVPFRPIEKYALTFPTIEEPNTIEERELLLKKSDSATENGKNNNTKKKGKKKEEEKKSASRWTRALSQGKKRNVRTYR